MVDYSPSFDTAVFASTNHYVVFGDLLGFADLVESSPTPSPDDIDAQQRGGVKQLAAVLAWENPLAGTFGRFHRELQDAINQTEWGTPLRAIIFSDSFFLASSTPNGALDFCERFARTCLCAMLPIRLGVGYGSFVTHRFAYESTQHSQIISSQFLGTGVTNAYAAERTEKKGMRIFLHDSLVEATQADNPRRKRFIALRQSAVTHEYSYLLEDQSSDPNQADDVIARTLTQMHLAASKHVRVQRHYDATRAAIDMMLEIVDRSVEWPEWSREIWN
jgi:hypothetical protein